MSTPSNTPQEVDSAAGRFARLQRAHEAKRLIVPGPGQGAGQGAQAEFDLMDMGLVGLTRSDVAQKAAVAAGVPPAATAMAMRGAGAAAPKAVIASPQRGLDLQMPPLQAPEDPTLRKAVGRIASVRFEKAEDNWYILELQLQGTTSSKDRLTVKGHGVGLKVGAEVEVQGHMHTDSKWGEQMKDAVVVEQLPVSEVGIRRLLERGFVKGIGPDIADKLLSRFGYRLFDVAEHTPEMLYEIDGVGAKRVESLVNAVKSKRNLPRIMSFLTEVGLGPARSHRVYRELGADAVNVIKRNPYELTAIATIGFKLADGVALKMGVPFDSDRRIVAAMEAVLLKASESGSTAIPVQKLKTDMQAILKVDGDARKVDPTLVATVVDEALTQTSRMVLRELSTPAARKALREEQGGGLPEANSAAAAEKVQSVSLSHFSRSEEQIAGHLLRLHRAGAVHASGANLSDIKFAHLDPSQLDAARRSLASPVSVITGRPGCGKTTITKSIIDAMEAAGMKVLLMAPTGKAAKRMSEATGRPATTVHRALKSMGAGKFGHDESNPLVADAIFADELSMMETHLMEKFLRAVKSGTQLVMVGDKDQLPSIGAGNVLADIIASEALPVSILNVPHRTAANSTIKTNAHRILNGEAPVAPTPGQDNDFELIDCKDKAEQVPQIAATYRSLLAKGFSAEDIQILTPMRKAGDPLGATELNRVLKEMLNPSAERPATDSVSKGAFEHKTTFSVGDRVMQMANNKELGIYNGDVGYIVEIDIDGSDKTIVVNFGDDDIVELTMSDLDDLDLAYATTIHKSQGSEYGAVIIPLSSGHSYFLDRSLLYTAETRGKKHVAMVGDTSILAGCVRKNDSAKRHTGLREEILAAFPSPDAEADIGVMARFKAKRPR